MEHVEEEWIELDGTDFRRFVTASAGHYVRNIEHFPLTCQFLPFALPSWGIVGARDLPHDGASAAAVPGVTGRVERVMGLGQQTQIHVPLLAASAEPLVLRRVGHLVADEQKDGASGPFRLLTVARDLYAGTSLVATQREFFAIGGQA